MAFVPDQKFWLGLAIYSSFWIAFFVLAGVYHRPFRKSRLGELGQSIGLTIIGCTIIFFALILDDYVDSYRQYYSIITILALVQFTLTYFPRLIITSSTIREIHSGKLGFPTVIIGNGSCATDFVEEMSSQRVSQGYNIIGYIAVSKKGTTIGHAIPKLGNIGDLQNVINSNHVQEAILATDSTDNDQLASIINELIPLNINLHAIPSMYDILSGRVKMSGILNSPLINISFELMPYWQQVIKYTSSYIVALIALIVLSPLSLVVICIIRLTSKGPIIYKQERIGQYGRPFMIYKFRSMYADAEHGGPALSSKHDSRVTPIGHFMRKTRIDEIPNFVNVLKGDMSLVGPRPERQFYIDQIVKVAPHYIHLQKIKPGITSWGQVKYGYAENVEQMVKRLRYDIIYLENMSIYIDIKIIIYTVITIFKGKGV